MGSNNRVGQRWLKKIGRRLLINHLMMVFGPKFQYFLQLNEIRVEATIWWLVSGPDVASSYFLKRKSVLHLNHEIPGLTDNYC